MILYLFLGFLASALNLAVQWPIFYFFKGWWVLYLALVIGTIVGLTFKYILDKKYVFSYKSNNIKDDLVNFCLYSFMGISTTIIFWATEIIFYHVFIFNYAQYIGGAVGLIIGYIIKYYLDKKFVFGFEK